MKQYIYKVTQDGKCLLFDSLKVLVDDMSKETKTEWSLNPFVYQFSVLKNNKTEYEGWKVERVKKVVSTEKVWAKLIGCRVSEVDLNLHYNMDFVKSLTTKQNG